jgi:lysozyme family protein
MAIYSDKEALEDRQFYMKCRWERKIEIKQDKAQKLKKKQRKLLALEKDFSSLESTSSKTDTPS